MKIGRNDPCPCGSTKKYKKCCRGAVDWEQIRPGSESFFRHLSVRGKNAVFIDILAGALQIDKIGDDADWSDVKRACTNEAVQTIYEGQAAIWPDEKDLDRGLKECREDSTALYIGSYEEDLVLRGITRHCLYADTILLPDPFVHPQRMQPEFNPIEHPHQFRMTTAKWARLWLKLIPWMRGGVIRFVRTPGDFDYALWKNCVDLEMSKRDSSPELRQIMEEEVSETTATLIADEELHLIGMPNTILARKFVEDADKSNELDLQRFMAYINSKRKAHPYYIPDPDGSGRPLNHQLLQYFTGASYEMAKLTAQRSGSHLITDMRTRWAEVEMDRDSHAFGDDPWQPFSKAFSNLTFSFLNDVPLQTALEIRRRDSLHSLRAFFRKLWKASVPSDIYSESATSALSDELSGELQRAKGEFTKIRSELAKWLVIEGAGALAGSQQAIASGSGKYLAAGVLTAAAATAADAVRRGRALGRNSPAAFLLTMERRAAKQSG